MFTPRLLLASILVTCCLTTSVFGATLPDDEGFFFLLLNNHFLFALFSLMFDVVHGYFCFAVQYLRDIAKTLGKTNWNFSVDPCSGEEGWATANPVKGFENAVTCNCSFSNATVCHVVSMYAPLSLSLFFFSFQFLLRDLSPILVEIINTSKN